MFSRFNVSGDYPFEDGQPVFWRGGTELIEREGRQLLVVKTPKTLQKPTLGLRRDKVVTASYEDETGRTSGPGQLDLGDSSRPIRRIIYGDEPLKKE